MTNKNDALPVAWLRASDLERLSQKHVAGCAASLSKEPGDGFVAIYTDALQAELAAMREQKPIGLGVWRKSLERYHMIGMDVEYIRRIYGPDSCDKGAGFELVDIYAAPPVSDKAGAVDFQKRVQPWLAECFGEVIAADTVERNHRFLEEALELVQSCDCTAEEAHKLVDYVYGRAVGEPSQEVGGVMVTLAALCLAQGLDMHANAETELARITQPAMVERIREKQKRKPAMSPLPGSYPERAAALNPLAADVAQGGEVLGYVSAASVLRLVSGAVDGVMIYADGRDNEALKPVYLRKSPAPIEDEREAFESHEARTRRLSPEDRKIWFRPGAIADYDFSSIDDAWKAWKARAAINQPTADVVAALPEKWEDRLSRIYPTIERGKWPKSFRDEAIQYELDQCRFLLATRQADGGSKP